MAVALNNYNFELWILDKDGSMLITLKYYKDDFGKPRCMCVQDKHFKFAAQYNCRYKNVNNEKMDMYISMKDVINDTSDEEYMNLVDIARDTCKDGSDYENGDESDEEGSDDE